MKSIIRFIFTICLLLTPPMSFAKDNYTTIKLNFIDAADAIATLKSLTKSPIAISEQNNLLIINAPKNKTLNLIKLIKEIDQPAMPLKLDFIASKRKISFNNPDIIYESSRNINHASQSMMITERQWVSLNTGLSIPITERKKSSDGSESVTTRYKDITQNYVFKVQEVNGQSIIQVGINTSKLSRNKSGAIEHSKLNTTIMGKTGEWLEVASSNKLSRPKNVITYSTNRSKNTDIHLYIKITK